MIKRLSLMLIKAREIAKWLLHPKWWKYNSRYFANVKPIKYEVLENGDIHIDASSFKEVSNVFEFKMVDEIRGPEQNYESITYDEICELGFTAVANELKKEGWFNE